MGSTRETPNDGLAEGRTTVGWTVVIISLLLCIAVLTTVLLWFGR